MAIITLNNNSLSSVTALPAGVGGKVLQVVQGIYTLFAQTNSQSFVDTGLSKTITPSSTSNKILAIASMQFRTNAAVSQTIDCDLVRDSSSVRQFNIALSQAISYKEFKIAKILLEHGAGFGADVRFYGDEPVSFIKSLPKYYKYGDFYKKEGYDLLIFAVNRKNKSLIEHLLKNGVDPSSYGGYDTATPLRNALCINDWNTDKPNKAIVNLLLKYGAKPRGFMEELELKQLLKK